MLRPHHFTTPWLYLPSICANLQAYILRLSNNEASRDGVQVRVVFDVIHSQGNGLQRPIEFDPTIADCG